jgi:transcriptional regulator with XRE-family HTH domain
MTGTELRRLRKRLGLTQATLGERMGVTANTIARWERGELPVPEIAARFLRLLVKTSGRPS